MLEPRLLGWCCLMWVAGTHSAWAQTVERNLSVTPHARAARPLVIIGPVQPAPPPASPPAAAHGGAIGSYAADAPGPDIRARNVDYTTPFSVIERVPDGATINQVAWRYAIAGKPPGFEAVLCWKDAATCWTVTDTSSGSTRFFNGRDATQPFTLHYRVRGSGSLAPLKGEMNQVIVTYDIPRP
ncbi:flagellar protein FlhE [Herbaspirillum sp. YR522]|uniref:flagellar protein FlhE n=1 Tax=Herbaspirillum sp. YR522 TaxID=1144342 RepID=UPI00026F5421|nr:flagellar protein FlhE [Herbaspirillum sp. YR522]EJM95358.1 Flagellar protein FlhE [Herbaspirillum sp. YR522]